MLSLSFMARPFPLCFRGAHSFTPSFGLQCAKLLGETAHEILLHSERYALWLRHYIEWDTRRTELYASKRTSHWDHYVKSAEQDLKEAERSSLSGVSAAIQWAKDALGLTSPTRDRQSVGAKERAERVATQRIWREGECWRSPCRESRNNLLASTANGTGLGGRAPCSSLAILRTSGRDS